MSEKNYKIYNLNSISLLKIFTSKNQNISYWAFVDNKWKRVAYKYFVELKNNGIEIIDQNTNKKFLYNMLNNKDPIFYEKVELEAMNVKELRALAKVSKINLYSVWKKNEIVNIMFSFFLELKNSAITDIEILPTKFDIITDSNNNINISLWFKGRGNLFGRCINSKRFNKLVKLHCEIKKKKRSDIIVEKNNDLFVDPILALHAATFLSVKLYYDILDFYIHSKYNRIEEIYNSRIKSLEQQIILTKLGIKLNKVSLWDNFNISFGYYYYVIKNVVKCGSVGLKDQENCDNLSARLQTHRSTYARFKLVNIIQFKDSNTVTLFENWMKQVLARYSIGKNDLVEQYECPGEKSEIIINDIVMKEFSAMTSGAGSLCPYALIEEYNKTTATKMNIK